MRKALKKHAVTLLIILLFMVQGCQINGGQKGIHVYFEQQPGYYQENVYWFGQVIGKIVDSQVGTGAVTRITVQLDPSFKDRAGKNWAFYMDSGRLTAGQLSPNRKPLQAGESISGFNSRAAFNWFKFKTLLNDRVGRSQRRADRLRLRFG
jgi:hypothetical protein